MTGISRDLTYQQALIVTALEEFIGDRPSAERILEVVLDAEYYRAWDIGWDACVETEKLKAKYNKES